MNTETGCWIGIMSLNEGGYVSLRAHSIRKRGLRCRRNQGKNFLLHRIAFLAWNNRDVKPTMVASHLCGTRSCFRPDHIVEETQSSNLSRCRTPCFGELRCLAHHKLLLSLCPHHPPCRRIRYVESSCCGLT